MGISGISSSLVTRLTGIASTSSKRSVSAELSSTPSQASSGNSQRLLSTAQVFFKAVQNFSTAGGAIQLSKEALFKLSDIVDKSIDLADKAAQSTTTNSTRLQLNRQFQKLGSEFNKLIEDSKADGIDELSEEGIAEIFALTGLTAEQSQELAQIFKSFVSPESDSALASLSIKGKSVILPQATQPPEPTEDYTIRQLSRNTGGTSPTVVAASANNTIFIDDQDPNNQNSNGSFDTSVIVDDLGNSQSIVGVTSDVRLLSTSELSGYSLVVSAQNFLGSNGSGVSQIFLLDESGVVVHQVTDFEQEITIESADLSEDGSRIAFVTSANIDDLNPDETESVYTVLTDPDQFGESAGGTIALITAFRSGSEIGSPVRISESGEYVAFDAVGTFTGLDGSQDGVFLISFDGEVDDALVNSEGTVIGFSADNTVVFKNGADDNIMSYRVSSGSGGDEIIFRGDSSYANFSVSQNGYLAFSSERNIYLSNLQDSSNSDTELVYAGTVGDSISSLSLTSDSSGRFKIVAAASLLSHSSVPQVYEFRETIQGATVNAARPDETNEIFDYTLKKRANAFRVKSDLLALKDQISENLSVLDKALQNIQNNFKLTLAFANSLYSVATDDTKVGDVDTIAKSLVSELRRYGLSEEVLNQTGNLRSIYSSALIAVA